MATNHSTHFGLMEEMFGAIGGEILYKPFDSDTAIGFALHRVKQRDYDQRFTFRDYKTTTGHFELFQESFPTDLTDIFEIMSKSI